MNKITLSQKALVTLFLTFFLSNMLKAQLQITLTPSDFNGYNISCFGAQNGSITATVTGGTPPYTLEWSTGEGTTTITDLAAGYYHVWVTDSLGNDEDRREAEITLTQPEALALQTDVYMHSNGYNVSCYNCFNGSITTTITGGVSPYTFFWEDGFSTQNRNSLGRGSYLLLVTDANGCEIRSEDLNVNEPERSDWTMTGNTGSNALTNFIGTIDSIDLKFKTKNIERIKIKADGKIFLNGESHINRIVTNRIVSTDSLIYIGDSTIILDPNYNRLWGDPNKGLGTGIGQLTTVNGKNSTAVGYGAETNADDAIAIGKFVKSNAQAAIAIGTGYVLQGSQQYFVNSTANSIALGCNSNVPTLFIAPSDGQAYHTGAVGIGTTSIPTGFKLAVNGNIIAEKIRIKLYANWPDYVFDDDYTLMPLSAIETFIKKYNHLPELPSAVDVKLTGFDVGEMQEVLLKKIEELTLHIILPEKRIAELEKLNTVKK